LACGVGAIPVFFLGNRMTVWRPLLEGITAGLMTAASIEGLIRPALKLGGILQTGLGLFVGVLFLLVLRQLMHGRQFEAGNLCGAFRISSFNPIVIDRFFIRNIRPLPG
jgi:ZIP family zinc transporter